MENKCLYCYDFVDADNDFHDHCSMAFFGTPKPPLIHFSLNQIDELAKNIVESSIAVPGVQPKLSMSVINEAKEKSRLTVVGALGGQFILKPPSENFMQMPENEHLTMQIAREFGIRTVPASLIRLASGEPAYITKRVDRTATGEKIHMIDMYQITEASDKYKSSMEKVGKALNSYSNNTLLDKIFYFELALFAFITGNNDMHLKNFSMIESSVGWVLAPAYDLLNVAIVNPADDEELALTLAGKKKKLKLQHFEQLAAELGLSDKQMSGTFNRLQKNYPKAIQWISRSFLSMDMQKAYIELLNTRYKQLGL